MAIASLEEANGAFADCAEESLGEREDLTFDLFISNSIYLCGWGNGYFRCGSLQSCGRGPDATRGPQTVSGERENAEIRD